MSKITLNIYLSWAKTYSILWLPCCRAAVKLNCVWFGTARAQPIGCNRAIRKIETLWPSLKVRLRLLCIKLSTLSRPELPENSLTYITLFVLGSVHMIPGQLIAPGQLTDPGVNFASVDGLTPVTVHMSFSLPRGNFKRPVTRCTTPGNSPCRGNFSPCEQNAKVAPGQE